MIYDLKADAFGMINRLEQKDRFREAARKRSVTEALAGHQARSTNPIPGLLGRLRELTKRQLRVSSEPTS
jgi:hypothetical protein